MGVARRVEDFFYEPFQVLGLAIIGTLCMAGGVARSVEDFFYEPFQVLGLAIIHSAWVLGTGGLYLVLCFLLQTPPGVRMAKICLQKSHLKVKKKEVCLLNR